MTEKEFFVEIIKASPDGSVVETTEYVDYETALELGIVNFKTFKPERVGLTFKVDNDSKEKWIGFFERSKLSDLITHYCIYKEDKVIAKGFDNFVINTFDSKFYTNPFNECKSDFEIHFTDKLTSGLPKTNKTIEFIKAEYHNSNYSTSVKMELSGEILNLRFAIEKQDFEVLRVLILEVNAKEHLIFKGVYASGPESQELGLTIKTQTIGIDLMIKSTRQLISNLIWFQQISDKKDIEKLIIK